MKQMYLLFLSFMCLPLVALSQITGNTAAIPERTLTDGPLSEIIATDMMPDDSAAVAITCSIIAEKEAILLEVEKFTGLSVNFRKRLGMIMFSQKLDSYSTEIDIKTIFAGIYYLDIFNEQGVKIKSYKIEKIF